MDDAVGQIQHKSGGFRVECGGVLIEQQDFARLQAGHQQAHGLALAAGKQPHAVGEAVFQPQLQQR